MNGVQRTLLAGIALAASCLNQAWAHKGSDAYLDVQEVGITAPPGRGGLGDAQRELRFTLSVAIKDLDLLVPLDADADGKVTWGELASATSAVLQLMGEAARVGVEAQPTLASAAPTFGVAPCALMWQADGVEQRSDGMYMRMMGHTRCPAAQGVALHYALFREQDATHRLLVAGHVGGQDLLTTTSPQRLQPLVLIAGGPPAGGAGTISVANAQPHGRWATVKDYFLLGMHHLLEGYDHLAFLLALVLPLRLSLRPDQRLGLSRSVVGHAEPTGTNVWLVLMRTITAFTVGHSVTLVLTTFKWTQPSPTWVEPAIAASIAVTAVLNIWPVRWLRSDALAGVFGLIHGFGFAGLLQEASAPAGLLPWALAGFNVGVEGGQLLAVSGWVLLSQLVVSRPWYTGVVVRGGSIALTVLASWWFWQRLS